ncbi:MAG: MBL fold metallo-hydrolase [Afipia sp.]|nr:MBL fold metallo-hydrolase [Afipia sp.]
MIRIGDVEISRIEEIVVLEASSVFSLWRKEMADTPHLALGPNYYDRSADGFVTSVHSWLVKTPQQMILIDTGSGNGKDRPLSPRFANMNTPYLERLKAAGAEPSDIDLVILTHLHIDHVGWNTQVVDGKNVPTFPNATYIMSRAEREVRDPKLGASMKPPAANLPFLDSVQPIIDAGKARIVEGTEQIAEGIDLMPVPGHAPGMMAVRVKSGGEEALFIGDVMHQPIQVYHPSWNSKYCEDQDLARVTRTKILNYAADTGCLLLPVHFGAPYCGRVKRNGDGYEFVPSDTMP